MALIKLAAAGAVGYALYKYIARRNDADTARNDGQAASFATPQSGSPHTVPATPAAYGNGYVAPI